MANFRIRVLWFIDQSWIAAFLLPLLYLLSNKAYFNQDDNFSQFTPAFKYAFDAILRGEFPWIHPGDLTSRLAQAPYYAIFSPVLFLAYLIVELLQLEPYWIINIWSLVYFTLINLLLLKFASRFAIPNRMKGALLICAGIGSYAGQFSVNWYYTLPPLLLLLSKIYYWQAFYYSQNNNDKTYNAILLIASYLAIYGGNPQLFFYVQLIELIFLMPLWNKKIFTLYIQNQVISLLLLTPWIYCQIEYWGNSWRTIYNANHIDLFSFIKNGSLRPHQAEGQSIWVVTCLIYLLFMALKPRVPTKISKVAISLAFISTMLLLAASIDIATIFGESYPFMQIFTTPRKWWFLGSMTSVIAVCLWSKSWTDRTQTYFAILALITSGIYLNHNLGKAAHLWGNLDYEDVNPAIQIIRPYANNNARVLQLSNFRNTDPHPSSNLLLNTWLTDSSSKVIFAKAYETVQAEENSHSELTNYFETQNLDLKKYQDLGVATLWVNKREYPKSLFNKSDYQILFEDQHHYIVKLTDPGKIVTCEKSNCKASLEFHADRILLSLENFSEDDVAKIKITPFSNFSIAANEHNLVSYICGDQWLCFKPNKGFTDYQIQYRDFPFLILLVGSNILFILLLVLNQIESNFKRHKPD